MERTRAEQELQESEQRYRSLFSNMLDGFAYCRMLYDEHDRPVDFVYLSVNEAFGRLTGLTDVVGKAVSEVIPGIRELSPEVFEIYGRVASTGIPETFEFDFKSQDQRLSISVYSPEKGSFVAVFDDITERKQSEQVMRDSVERFQLASRATYNAIWDLDLRTNKMWRNEGFQALFGYEAAEIEPDLEFGSDRLHPEDFQRAKESLNAALNSESESWSGEYRFRRKDGSYATVEDRGYIIRDAQGRAVRMLGAMQDITVRKEAERRLADALRYNETVMEASPVGIITYKASGEAVASNLAAAHLIGATREQMEKQNFRRLESWRRSGLLAAADDALASHEPRKVEIHTTSTFGKEVRLNCRFIPFTYENEPHLLVLSSDISERKRTEEAEARLVAILEATPDLVSISDPEGRLIYLNRSGRKMLGMDERADLTGFNLEEFHDATNAHVSLTEGIPIATREGSWSGETELVALDGHAISVSQVIVAHKAPNGTVTFLSTTARDISDRKRAEETRRESEARNRSILSTSPDAIAIADLEGRMLLASPAALKMFGCAREEDLVGHLLFEFMVPGERDRAASSFANTLRGFAPELAEYRGLHSDGSTFDIEVNSDLVRGADGQPTAVVIVGREITERKQAEKVLRLQAAALLAAADAIVITDREGAIEWVNPSFTQLTGYTAEEALGKNLRDLVKSGKQDPAVYKYLWDTILAGRTWHGEMINRRKDGSLYSDGQTVTPIVDASGAITHFVAIKEDITERLRLQAQLLQAQKMESVGSLAGGVAHDFNNLLSVILGWTGMALEDLPVGNPVRASLEEVLRAGERAAALTKQLLTFARKQVVKPTLFNANALILETDKMLRRLLGEDVEVVIRTDPELGNVKMDRGQLEQVLMNLAVNARDAMPMGGKLTIETTNVALDDVYPRRDENVAPGDYVMLSLSDSGIGMSREVMAQIFEPFFTTKPAGKGTGLGLSTSYGIVKQAGGQIVVYSEEGLGTTMKVYLPRARADSDAAVDDRQNTPAGGTETILVVEDDAAVRRVSTQMLERVGYRVVSVGSGEEALQVIGEAREPLHLVLTDVVLGAGISGPVLADRVRASRPDLKMLFVSGYSGDVTIQHGLRESGIALVQKPFTAELLARKVREVLDAE
jgi:PAS domain S-box-containing protein